VKDYRGIFAITALIALLLLAFFVIWRAFSGGVETPRAEIPLPATENKYVREPRAPQPFGKVNEPSKNAQPQGLDPLAGVLDPDTIIDTVEPLLPVLPAKEEGSIQKKGEAGIVENLFPKQYIESLMLMQDGLVQAGWLKAEEKSSLTTENEVQQFLERAVEALIANNAYPSETYAQVARNAVRQFPKLWESEREFLRGRHTGFLPGRSYEQKRGNILDGLLSAIFPKEANAQISDWVDDFVTLPDCWKAKDRLNFSGGSNLWAFCCNCGLFCSYGCTFYWDCGKEDDSKCNVPFGCLNAVCRGDANAIFDGLPGYEVPATAGWGGGTNMDYSLTCGCDA